MFINDFQLLSISSKGMSYPVDNDFAPAFFIFNLPPVNAA